MIISLFISPRDISLEFALLNRAFFALILIIASVFIAEYVGNVEGLALSEERYRNLIEWQPQGIIVCRKGVIAYINPAGQRLFGTVDGETIAGRPIAEMIDPAFREEFRQRLDQAELGARIDLNNVRILRKDLSPITVGISLGAMTWDNEPAVQILLQSPG
jgi:PAS domain S-box-containing protein